MSFATLAKDGFVAALDAYTANDETWVHLYTNDPPLTDALHVSDFDEIVFDGYAPIAAYRWTPAAIQGDAAESVADPMTWRYTTGATPPPVRGCYATVGPGGPLKWAWRRPGAAFPIGPATPVLTVVVTTVHPGPAGP